MFKFLCNLLVDERGEFPDQDDLLGSGGPISDDIVVPPQDLDEDDDKKTDDADDLPTVPASVVDDENDSEPIPVPDDTVEDPAPKFEGFGDNPTVDEVYSKYKEVMGTFEDFKGRAGATERNLANIRKSLKTVGLTTLKDEEGNYTLSPLPEEDKPGSNSQEISPKFSEEDRQSLNSFFETEEQAGQFINSMSKMIEDIVLRRYTEQTEQQQAQQRFYNDYYIKRKQNADKIRDKFPMAAANLEDGSPNPVYNKALNERATEIYEKDFVVDGKETDPFGQWRSVLEAANELGISPIAVTKAVKKAVTKAKEEKKILGPVSGGSDDARTDGRLTKEGYLSLSLDEREKYDKQQSGIS